MELSPKNISVVIPAAGKRTKELEQIISHLKGLGFEDLIIIHDDGNRLLNRKFGAYRAKYDWIYTQDDDVIVKNIPELIKEAEDNKIVANMQEKHIAFYEKEENGGGKICLIGWGGIFKRDLFFNCGEYTKKFPQDDLYKREFDRVFTWLNEKKLIIGDLEHFESAKEGMYKDKGHWDDLKAIINNLKQL